MNTAIITIISVLSIFYCVGTAMPARGSCLINPRLRVECGFSGITAAQCRMKGCCWDEKEVNAIHCFKDDQKRSPGGAIGRVNPLDDMFAPISLINTGDKSTMDTCAVSIRDRVLCGHKTISRTSCEDRGCCFAKTTREGPLCYLPEDLLIASRMRHLMECTWECSGVSYKKISGAYKRCATNRACWMMTAGQSAGNCLVSCKHKLDFDTYINNITKCLGLTQQESSETRKECNTDVSCWIDLHGEEALSCFLRFRETGTQYSVEIPTEPEESILPVEPEVHEPEVQQEVEEPEEQGYIPPFQRVVSYALRTSGQIETSNHHLIRHPFNAREEEKEEEE